MPSQSLELFVIWILCENTPRFLHGIKLKCSNLYSARLRIPTVFEAGLLKEVGERAQIRLNLQLLKAGLSNMVAMCDRSNLTLRGRVQLPILLVTCDKSSAATCGHRLSVWTEGYRTQAECAAHGFSVVHKATSTL